MVSIPRAICTIIKELLLLAVGTVLRILIGQHPAGNLHYHRKRIICIGFVSNVSSLAFLLVSTPAYSTIIRFIGCYISWRVFQLASTPAYSTIILFIGCYTSVGAFLLASTPAYSTIIQLESLSIGLNPFRLSTKSFLIFLKLMYTANGSKTSRKLYLKIPDSEPFHFLQYLFYPSKERVFTFRNF